jgi:hypothetical protein
VPEVYRDYLSVAQRTGFDPPRKVVEENLWEIARRIRVKEAFYARLVQKNFRVMQVVVGGGVVVEVGRGGVQMSSDVKKDHVKKISWDKKKTCRP